MKATDLMIGDWVYSTFSDTPCRVLSIGISNYGFGVVIVDNVGGAKDVASITPIPLTPEILEKNGFIIKKKWAQRGSFGDNPLIIWHLDDDPVTCDYRHELEIHDNATAKIHVRVPCEYVHELQHALRLCEIKKEIEL